MVWQLLRAPTTEPAHCNSFGTVDDLASRNAADSAARVGRRKSVRFSPLVSSRNITPSSLVYGVHPREFDFDERGRMVSRQRSHQAPHVREIRVREAPAILDRLSSSLLPLDGSRSQEEECKLMTDRSGRRRRRERSRDGWQATDQSAAQIDRSKHTCIGAVATVGHRGYAAQVAKVPSGR